MPELPEVGITRRGIAPLVEGRCGDRIRKQALHRRTACYYPAARNKLPNI